MGPLERRLWRLSPFHTLNLLLRQPLPFPCLWEPKEVSRIGQGFGDTSVQVLFLPYISPAAGLQTTRKMEGGISTFQRGGSVSTGVGSLRLRVVPFSRGPLQGRGN